MSTPELLSQPGRERAIAAAALACASAKHLVVLTGAGVSAESGVPTFRDKDGLWDKYDVTTLATPEAFEEDPAFVWQWYDWRRQKVKGVKPNPGHYAIAELEKLARARGAEFTLITQNIDNLHNLAGSENVLELHGNIWKARRWGTGPDDASVREFHECPLAECPPRDADGAILRPHIVWFGEMLSVHVIRAAEAAAVECDAMLVVGTSNVVYPAAALPYSVLRRRGTVVEINPGVTPLTCDATISIRAESGSALPEIVAAMREM
ncbi:MAG: NAD-dependent deacylase [bacterium]|jgi:NAD-dependent deacetylase